MQNEAKRQIGDYEILERLGAGAMGEVYKVRNTISDRVEAMKIMLPSLAGDKQQLDDRFRREIKLVASLSHPHIAGLCTALTINGQFVMVMEYVEGVTFESLLKRGPIAVANAVDYVDQAADALGFAHKRGITHRDIKPANFMLMASGTVKLMDFGIARANTEPRLTQTGATVGTLYYMSPEQITGQTVDGRSDLYSLGISLYEMVTGTVPFKSESGYQILTAHLNEAPRRPIELKPDMPARLNEIILKLIAKKPEERFQTAEELRGALKTVGGTAVEMPSFQNVDTAGGTIFEPSPLFSGVKAGSGAGSTSFMEAAAIAPDLKKVTPVPVEAAKTFGMSWPIVAGLVLLMVGVGTATTYVSRSHKEESKTPQLAAPPQTSTQTPEKQAPPPKSPNGPTVPNGANMGMAGRAGAAGDPMQAQLAASGAAGLRRGRSGPAMSANGTLIVGGAAAGSTPVGPSPQDKERLDAVEVELDGYNSRAAAYNSSLNTMRAQQQQMGMSMRTDMTEAQASMNLSLKKAQQALQAGDANRAESYARQAKNDLDKIDGFLHGR